MPYIHRRKNGGNRGDGLTFSVGDRVLHPLHGAGTVTSICVRPPDRQSYYVLQLALDGATVYVPVSGAARVGLRPVCSEREAQRLLCGAVGALPPQPSDWSARYRENMARERSGETRQVAQVVCCLRRRNRRRALTGSEKRMLECAERILHSELMLAAGLEREAVSRRLERIWNRLNEPGESNG